MRRNAQRRGTILIAVAGLVALMTSLALAFTLRMRSDGEEVGQVVHESQARIMLVAGCNYVQECARIGWNRPGDAALIRHKEAYGWIDVRDGSVGPSIDDGGDAQVPVPVWSPTLVEDRDGNGGSDRPAWPAPGSVARCPMYVMQRPPFAIRLTVACNPISDPTSPDFGIPYLKYRDPLPVVDDAVDHWAGDTAPRPTSLDLGWFRVYREAAAAIVPAPSAAARFVVSCGSGSSRGFRDWDEVRGASATASFGGDRLLFDAAVAAESRMWYRVEWSAAIKDVTYHCLENDMGYPIWDHYVWYPMNSSHTQQMSCARTQSHARNMIGTIRWVQRLPGPPTHW